MKNIPFSPPYLTEEDIDTVTNVLKSGWITSGSIGQEFVSLLMSYTRAKSSFLLNSATSGLFIALKALGIGEGDEVITTPYTFAATANVIKHTGAKLVFADVKKDSFYLDIDQVFQKITPQTKAIIPVDFSTAGEFNLNMLFSEFHPANSFQEQLGRPLILLDSAHALGSRFLDTQVDMAVYSFHAVKNLTTGEGGALSINSLGDESLDTELFNRINHLILHGQNKSAQEKFVTGTWEYDIVVPGYKCNMPDILAALGLSQLKRYESDILPYRRSLTHYYKELLSYHPRIIMDESSIFDRIDSSSCHLMPIRIKDYTEEERNNLIKYCCQRGVMLNVHYKPLTLMTAYYTENVMPNSQAQYCNQISLPLHRGLTKKDIEYVVEILIEGLK